jgi:hypothetical protein
MKPKKFNLILGVVCGILCVAALAQIESPNPDEPILIAPPNPALVGIEPLAVVITTQDQEPNRIGLDSKVLKTEVEQTLEKAGIKVLASKGSVTLKSDISPDLRISIETLYLGNLQQCVFRIQTSLSRAVRLDGQSNLLFKANVWTAGPLMQIGQLKDIRSKVTKVALSQVDAFILAYRTAIRPDISSPDANESPLLQVPAIKESSKQPVKKVVTEYQYVASKNSTVFHTLTCRSAKRISPENLVGYKTRQEAINAGKRPCKLCSP